MHYWTDIHLNHDDDNDRIAAAVAAAFGVSASRVIVADAMTPELDAAWDMPGLFALVQRDDLIPPAERDPLFSATFQIIIRHDKPDASDRAVLETIARVLDQPVMSDIAADGPDTWRLFWPDGTSMPVLLEDDDNIILSRSDRDRLNRTGQHVTAA